MQNTIQLKDNLFITTDLNIPAQAKRKLSGLATFISEEEARPHMPMAGDGMFVNFSGTQESLVSSRDSLFSAVDKLKTDPTKLVSQVKFSIYSL